MGLGVYALNKLLPLKPLVIPGEERQRDFVRGNYIPVVSNQDITAVFCEKENGKKSPHVALAELLSDELGSKLIEGDAAQRVLATAA